MDKIGIHQTENRILNIYKKEKGLFTNTFRN